MKTTLLTIAICVMTIVTGFSQTKHHKKMNTIVLVHGAWLDASSWDKVVPALKAAGHEVITVNLPGHGKDNTPYTAITMQSYVDAVKKAIGTRSHIILVGHSMGGLVISETAEQIPTQISKLVYLAAFLPRNGESLMQLSSLPENKESLLGKYIRVDEKTGSGTIAKEGLRETFIADAPEAIAEHIMATHKPDAMAPFLSPVTLTAENFGSIKKSYIYTLNDRAIGYGLQAYMVQNTPVSSTYAIPTSHTPFFSMPGVVAAILLQEAQ